MKNLKDLATDIEKFMKELEKLDEKIANELVERTKRRTPVRSGKLQNSYEVQMKPDGFEIRNDQDYVFYVELGTTKTDPVRMAGRAVDEMPQVIEKTKPKQD